MIKKPKYPKVLTIAGSDSGGGAGIQADLKTYAALGCYGMSALTAITAQNTQGVLGIHAIPPLMIGQQIQAVLEDIGTDAIKIGMLHDEDTIYAVQQSLQINAKRWNWLVLDPVMVATSGDRLIKKEAEAFLVERLFPIASVITPNLPEAELLLGRQISSSDQMLQAAKELLELGPHSVLLKGGHLEEEELVDIFLVKNESKPLILKTSKIHTSNIHGTGCTLSSAIAAHLALGNSLRDSVSLAHGFLQQAIEAGKEVLTGGGHGPVNHGFDPRKMKIVGS
ncbi:MAG: bifunctional hydroxymethylpyrimidine kinase/phosphomethylpyrimidine kinase [Bacteroidota bacterium]